MGKKEISAPLQVASRLSTLKEAGVIFSFGAAWPRCSRGRAVRGCRCSALPASSTHPDLT
jgi:hypothetical protein